MGICASEPTGLEVVRVTDVASGEIVGDFNVDGGFAVSRIAKQIKQHMTDPQANLEFVNASMKFVTPSVKAAQINTYDGVAYSSQSDALATGGKVLKLEYKLRCSALSDEQIAMWQEKIVVTKFAGDFGPKWDIKFEGDGPCIFTKIPVLFPDGTTWVVEPGRFGSSDQPCLNMWSGWKQKNFQLLRPPRYEQGQVDGCRRTVATHYECSCDPSDIGNADGNFWA